jgi:hypothetical protein
MTITAIETIRAPEFANLLWVQEMLRAFYSGWYHRFVTKLPPLVKGEIMLPEGPASALPCSPMSQSVRPPARGARRP